MHGGHAADRQARHGRRSHMPGDLVHEVRVAWLPSERAEDRGPCRRRAHDPHPPSGGPPQLAWGAHESLPLQHYPQGKAATTAAGPAALTEQVRIQTQSREQFRGPTATR